METKICSKCNIEKTSSNFAKNGKYLYSKCKQCVREYHKNYLSIEENKKTAKLREKNWRLNNPDKIKIKREKYKVRRNVLERKNYNIRIKKDIKYKLILTLRRRFSAAVTNNYKKGSAVKDLGCSIEFLKQYLESKFRDGMTWQNHGKVWHIDHARPLVSFDLSNKEQVKQACHYTNLQPLLIHENLSKGAKYDSSNK